MQQGQYHCADALRPSRHVAGVLGGQLNITVTDTGGLGGMLGATLGGLTGNHGGGLGVAVQKPQGTHLLLSRSGMGEPHCRVFTAFM
jgi:hypothetical protein